MATCRCNLDSSNLPAAQVLQQRVVSQRVARHLAQSNMAAASQNHNPTSVKLLVMNKRRGVFKCIRRLQHCMCLTIAHETACICITGTGRHEVGNCRLTSQAGLVAVSQPGSAAAHSPCLTSVADSSDCMGCCHLGETQACIARPAPAGLLLS